jgi:hypothetical protein
MRNKKTLAGLALIVAALAGCGSTAAAVTPRVTVTHTAKPAPAKTVYRTVPAKPAATTPAPVAPVEPIQPPAAPALVNADAVVTQFYQDITDQNYGAAWQLGGDNIGGTDYTAWVNGYGTTESISLGSFSEFGSDQVQVVLTALQDDGTVKEYTGTYTVADGVITAANITQNY